MPLAIYKEFEEKMMPTVKFDDYLEKRFQDPELRSILKQRV